MRESRMKMPDGSFAKMVTYIQASPYNTEELITESGEWTAKVSGWHEVTCIGGGDGAVVFDAPGHCSNGASGAYVTKDVYLSKGEIIPVTIGAGGIGDVTFSSLPEGGQTSFGEYVTTVGSNRKFGRTGVHVINVLSSANTSKAEFSGAGLGGVIGNGVYYGAGAGARLQVNQSGEVLNRIVGNGASGCVRIRFFDPAKVSQPVINQGE